MPTRWLILTTLALLLAVLFFGLHPRGFDFTNHAAFLPECSGIRFEKYSVAHTAYSMDWRRLAEEGEPGAFSLCLAFTPADGAPEGFAFIAVVHGGRDGQQLLIGQWRSWVIVMNGDDYDHRRKTPRISFDSTGVGAEEILLCVTSGPAGTRLFVNGEPVRDRPDMRLDMPPAEARLVLGNSVYGTNPWQGDIFGLWGFHRDSAKNDIRKQTWGWKQVRGVAPDSACAPSLVFRLDGKTAENDVNADDSDRVVHLKSGIPVLSPRFLSFSLSGVDADPDFIFDAVVNLLGFIPLAMALALSIRHIGGIRAGTAGWIAAGVCCGLSLGIELLQAWMPTRSSSGIDLLLNTLGGIAGAVVAAQRWKARGVRFTV